MGSYTLHTLEKIPLVNLLKNSLPFYNEMSLLKTEETYTLHNGSINIPFIDFIKEKNKYQTKSSSIKRFLYNNIEAFVTNSSNKKCYRKELLNYNKNSNKNSLVIQWYSEKIEWINDIDWNATEEYTCEEYSDEMNNLTIYFITTSKGFRRILKQKIILD